MRIHRPNSAIYGFRPLPQFLPVILLTTIEFIIINLPFLGTLILSYSISVFSHEPVALYLEHVLLPISCQEFQLLLGSPSPRLSRHA